MRVRKICQEAMDGFLLTVCDQAGSQPSKEDCAVYMNHLSYDDLSNQFIDQYLKSTTEPEHMKEIGGEKNLQEFHSYAVDYMKKNMIPMFLVYMSKIQGREIPKKTAECLLRAKGNRNFSLLDGMEPPVPYPGNGKSYYPATEKQKEKLQEYGYDILDEELTAQEASECIRYMVRPKYQIPVYFYYYLRKKEEKKTKKERRKDYDEFF